MAASLETFGFIPGLNLNDAPFSSADLASAEQVILQTIQDRFPTLDISRASSIYDLVVRPMAVLYLLNRKQCEALQATMSLKGVLDNPNLASDKVVDAILSNLSIVRKPGTKSNGRIKISVSSSNSFIIRKGVTFITPFGISFVTTNSYTVTKLPGNTGDLKLYTTDSNDQFYFFLPVEAVVSGVSGQIGDLTELTPDTVIPNLISSLAFGAFSGGSDQETNVDLVARILSALSIRNLASRTSIYATLKDNFPTLKDVSVQGMADPCMTRDSGNIFGISAGGFVDIYVRTALGPSIGQTSATAQLQTVSNVGVATYSVLFNRDALPGHYFCRAVYPEAADVFSSYQIVSQTKGFSNQVDVNDQASGVQVSNRIYTNLEAGYSRYQTTTVIFLVNPPIVPFAHPQQLSITAEFYYQPLINSLQLFINNAKRKLAGADYLVKGVIPCFVSLSELTVRADHGTATAQNIQTAVYSLINSVPIGQILRLDDLVEAVRQINGVRNVQLPISLSGKIYCPDEKGTILSVATDGDLSIPTRTDLMVSSSTTAFFISINDIAVSLIELA